MFINARIDGTFIEKPYHVERERFAKWLDQIGGKQIVLLELGAGYNTPMVIRIPMERLAASFKRASFIRVNLEYAQVTDILKHNSLSVKADIREFIEGLTP